MQRFSLQWVRSEHTENTDNFFSRYLMKIIEPTRISRGHCICSKIPKIGKMTVGNTQLIQPNRNISTLETETAVSKSDFHVI